MPTVSVPKGGGAIRGIGEKFATNPVTGTGAVSVPVPMSPARSNLAPELSLAYDSGSGNGPFGFGWSLSLPTISRKTQKGLPRYDDAGESDVFVLAGAEDLVPMLDDEGARVVTTDRRPGFRIERYRPRVETSVSRIERWTELATAEVHWRTHTTENVLSIYGRDDRSRIVDSDGDQSDRIFSWLICETRDDMGNAIVFEYVPDDARNVDESRPSEQRRTRGTNRYLRRVRYGNTVSHLVDPDLVATDWLFDVVLDYGEAHVEDLPLNPAVAADEQHRRVLAGDVPAADWALRPDPFSSYRAGFEVRTQRRCHRILVFHRFPELHDAPYLVRSLDIDYADLQMAGAEVGIDQERAHQGSTRLGSFLRRIVQSGYILDADAAPVVVDGHRRDTYLHHTRPALEFSYTKAAVANVVQYLDEDSVTGVPAGTAPQEVTWVDLDGVGLSGPLFRDQGAWRYKPNLGGGRLGPQQVLPAQPLLFAGRGAGRLVDLDGDGSLDVATYGGPTPGFHERTAEGSWGRFRNFAELPTIDIDDPNARLVDLTGDGLADVLVTDQDELVWLESKGDMGFGAPRRTTVPWDEDDGPRVVFADGQNAIHLADMSGDGLVDLVRVRDGEICYWPNIGHGRFAAKVRMDGVPRVAPPDHFDPGRIRLADVDGSGATDLIYTGADGVSVAFNLSGNGWSALRELPGVVGVSDAAHVELTDLLGNGTACLVWSDPLPASRERPVRYVDLMGGVKPHLLATITNNLGAETRISYAASTRFSLADQAAGRPWRTRIPFPVHVVDRVVTIDHVGRNRFVTEYAYHHGHYDGEEREFRGFGMVERLDTARHGDEGEDWPEVGNLAAESHVPPALVRSWFHTGAPIGIDRREYFRAPGLDDAAVEDLLLTDIELPVNLSGAERRGALHALRGSLLRRETYALDGTDRASIPYLVTEHTFAVRLLQERGPKQHAVFRAHQRETLERHYERALVPTVAGQLVDAGAAVGNRAVDWRLDARVTHTLDLDVDEFGTVLLSVSASYGRELADPSLPAATRADQARNLVTMAERRVTNGIDDDAYRTPTVHDERTWQLTGYPRSGPAGRFVPSDLAVVDPADPNRLAALTDEDLSYEVRPTVGRQRRLVSRARTRYRREDLTGPLPLGEMGPRAIRFASYELALTAGLVASVFDGRVDGALLGAGAAGYVHVDDGGGPDADWWIPSGRQFYTADSAATPLEELTTAEHHFFRARRFRDPFHRPAVPTDTVVTYDDHDLLLLESRDPVGNRTTAGTRRNDADQTLEAARFDYRVLQPAVVMEPNRNRTELAFDAFGQVAATAVRGTPEQGEAVGDHLDPACVAEPTRAQLDALLAAPSGALGVQLLGPATTRIVTDPSAHHRAADGSTPVWAVTLARETHTSDPAPPGGLRVQVSIGFSDGQGREIQRKERAEPGPGPVRGADGDIVLGPERRPLPTPVDVEPRWIGTGWTVLDNKGDPVRRFEPFFTDRHGFERDVRVGVSTILGYDPIGRKVLTIHPDHTWEKVDLGPWSQQTWDAGDTVAVADPVADPTVGGLFSRLPADDYLPTWLEQRQGGGRGPDAQAAATRSVLYAGTPAVEHADALGRTIASVAHDRYPDPDDPAAPPVESMLVTRYQLDISGRQLGVVDARDREVIRHHHDLRGREIHHTSMDAGQRWILDAADDQPLMSWTSRGDRIRIERDALRRPTATHVSRGGQADVRVDRTIYGDQLPDPEVGNRRGQVVEQYDQAGVIATPAYDFKGNPLGTTQRFAESVTVNGAPVPAHRVTVDWSAAVVLSATTRRTATRYDALDRPVQLVAPHVEGAGAGIHVSQPRYNEAGLIDGVDVWLDRPAIPNQLIDPLAEPPSGAGIGNVDYEAKGQRIRVRHGNGAVSHYAYDPDTFRPATVYTRRDATFSGDCTNPAPPPDTIAAPHPPPEGVPCGVQHLVYTYDCVGNVTHRRDLAQPTVFHAGVVVDSHAEYTYDAVYRLIEGTGREHLGQTGDPVVHSYDDAGRTRRPHPNDGQALARYVERYRYDEVANLTRMEHRALAAGAPSWSRTFVYAEPSQLKPEIHGNRLTSSTVGATTSVYSVAGDGYDDAGNMLRMPHLQQLVWNETDQLRMTRRQAVEADDVDGALHVGERTWYVYGASGARVRKVTEGPAGQVRSERLYLDGIEIHTVSGTTWETLGIAVGERGVVLVQTRTAGGQPGDPPRVVRYQHRDHLGTVGLELDQQSRVLTYEEHTPYGSTSYEAVSAPWLASKRQRFAGHERDDESGLYHQGARYAAPWLGRWLGADPEGLVDGPNVFAYAQANPVRLVDETGTHVTDSNQGRIGNKRDYLNGAGAQGRYLFTEGGGWIDRSHAQPGHVWGVLRDLQAGRDVNFELGGLRRTYTRATPVTGQRNIERAAVAITHDALYRFEERQSRDLADVIAATPFSYEDVTSNRVGIEIGVRFYREARRRGLNVDQELNALRADRAADRLYRRIERQVITELQPTSRAQGRRQYYAFLRQHRLLTSGEWAGEGRAGQLRDYAPQVDQPRNRTVRPYHDATLSPVDRSKTPRWLQHDPASPRSLGFSHTEVMPAEDTILRIWRAPGRAIDAVEDTANEALRQLDACVRAGGRGCFW
ncbi:MAG: toxin [Actinomycetota bacterium]|nr:toxin [Actinomycetota bacterium]